ncbi:MAG: hypothetical protein JNM94_07790 [Phycisphaerae bacterium]|nr:hypothetical protein [Phycisphaerae bacterium]
MTTARLRVPPHDGPLRGRRPVSLTLGLLCFALAVAVAAVGGPVIAKRGRMADLLPTRTLIALAPAAPVAALSAISNRVRTGTLTPDDAARCLKAVAASPAALRVAFSNAVQSSWGGFEAPLIYPLMSLAREAGPLGGEAYLALAAPKFTVERDATTGEGIASMDVRAPVEGSWVARIEEVTVDGVAVPWSIEGEWRIDRRPAKARRMLYLGDLRLHVPFERLAAANVVEVRFIGATLDTGRAMLEDERVNDDPPEAWGIETFVAPGTCRAIVVPDGRDTP